MNIHPTTRSIRFYQKDQLSQNRWLEKSITISEFLNNSVWVNNKKFVDNNTRTFFLQQASQFDDFSKLFIPRDFFSFFKNAHYLFKFYEELALECVDINDLKKYNIYEDYSEHLDILETLKTEYKKYLDKNNIIDKIFLPQIYKINKSYIKSFEQISFYIEGYLTKYEYKLLKRCSKFTLIDLLISSTAYNKKLLKILDLDLEEGFEYRIDLANKKVLKKEKSFVNETIYLYECANRLLQIAFIKERIFYYTQVLNLLADDIVVVLPDESYASYLKLFDHENYFNYTMGLPLVNTSVIKALQAMITYKEEGNFQNKDRLSNINTKYQEYLKYLDTHYSQEVANEQFKKDLDQLFEEEKFNIKKILLEELEKIPYAPAYKELLLYKDKLKLFLNTISALTIDDKKGGKITVMSILETINISFKGVIVIDFNEGIVPRSNDKDLYLNSTLKEKIGLFSNYDKMQLQQHYYHRLFNKSQVVSISYTNENNALPSKFLNTIQTIPLMLDQTQMYHLLFKSNAKSTTTEEVYQIPYDFKAHKLSASKLKTYLTCTQKFYFKYIQKLVQHKVPSLKIEEYELGNHLHLALKNLYSKQDHFTNIDQLRKAFFSELKNITPKDILTFFYTKQWEKRLHLFFDNEIKHFTQGYRVKHAEKYLSFFYKEIEIEGYIDRIDENNGLNIYDYKSGSYTLYTDKTIEKANDFQLEFYYILSSYLGDINSIGFYDLKKGRIVNEELLEEKKILLNNILERLRKIETIQIEKTEEKQACAYCDYKTICDR